MRAYLPAYDIVAPKNLEEALKILKDNPGCVPIAGGTDLMVLFEAGKLPTGKYLSIWGLKELQGIAITPERITINALATYSQIQKENVICKEFPSLCLAARETGSVAIQNRGTLAGNIVNASPAADSSPPLLVYEAIIEVVSCGKTRQINYRDFHQDYKKIALEAGELVSAIHLKREKNPDEISHYFRKVGTRKAQAISKVCMAAVAKVHEKKISSTCIALGSVAPIVVRATKTEEYLQGQELNEKTIALAQDKILEDISPIDDVRSSLKYRQKVIANLLAEFLEGFLKK